MGILLRYFKRKRRGNYGRNGKKQTEKFMVRVIPKFAVNIIVQRI
ncbi:hypothetical protein [Anaerotignum lactatifermentans]|nr:hypothetical protein [Anaerotignum lactatifermentans]